MSSDDWQPPADTDAVVGALFDWFEEHRRPFPWRTVDDPWQLLVLEVMSQQTQLERVSDPWATFVDRWPTPAALTEATKGEVVAFWSEHRLGYNRRAAYLYDAAEAIEGHFGGTVPSTPSELQTLSGVGPYTANAVASFAFDTGGPVIDTNVRRILHRAFEVEDTDAAYERAAGALAPSDAIGRWNAAVMELGGVACGSTPRCDEAACPLRRWCRAYRTGDFTAPDVPTQPAYEGSRRQYRGRVLDVLRETSPVECHALGSRIKGSFDPASADDRAWLRSLLEDMAAEDLVSLDDDRVSLPS